MMSKRKPSTLYCLRPQHDRVDHELFHHRVFGGRVGAAALAEHDAVAVEPVVVAGHELVENGVRVLAGRVGVVVDHVHDHAQAALVQRLHHLAEFEDACGAIGIGGVAALGHVVVQRVVAPVECVAIRRRRDQRLLLGGIRRQRGERVERGRLPRGLVLVGGGEVERRQQVHVRDARQSQGRQVLHAIRALLRERRVGAALVRRNGGVGGAEVTHVQFVQHDVFGRGEIGLVQLVPAARLQLGVFERHDLAARAVARQRDRVGIGDDVGLDPVGGAHEDLGLVQVVLAVDAGRRCGEAPDAARGIERHGMSREARGVRVRKDAQAQLARGRRPHAKRRLSVLEARPERDRPGLGGIQVIENAGDLQRGGVDALDAAHRADGNLAFQALCGGRDRVGGQLECREVREVRKLRAQRGGQARRIVRERPGSASSRRRRCRGHRA